MKTQFVNFTPHTINVLKGSQPALTLAPCGTVARCSTTKELVSDGEVQVFRTTYGEVLGLPEPEEGNGFIVSALVRCALPDRKDLFSPGELVRNEAGQPIGCEGLTCN